MSDLRFFYPGDELSGVADADLKRLDALDVFRFTKGRRTFRGPGFVSFSHTLLVVLPRPYATKAMDSGAFLQAHVLMGVLHRYRNLMIARQGKAKAVVQDDETIVSDGDVGAMDFLGQVAAALELIAEEAENGAFVESERAHDIRGRVNWRQTLIRHPPTGQPYGEVQTGWIAHRVRRTAHTPLAIAHRKSLECANALLHGETVPQSVTAGVLEVIDRVGIQLFTDRAKRLVPLMRRLHEGRRISVAHGCRPFGILMARRFEKVWEAMLVAALGPTVRRPLPSGIYGRLLEHGSGHDQGDSILEVKGADLFADLVVEDRGQLFILDAKDYAPGHYPETESITKQILYRILHSDLYDTASSYRLANTYNGFLFPGVVSTPRGVMNLRCHTLAGDAAGWGTIAGVAVDLERVSRAFLGGRADPALRMAVVASVRAQSPPTAEQ